MKDRVPRYPGRVQLTPVPGQANTYDLVRADDPVEPGTPLNKASLLQDNTATALGLSGDPTVNDALARIKPMVDAATTKTAIVTGTYTGDGAATRTINLGFQPGAVLLFNRAGETFRRPGSATNNEHYGGLALRNNPVLINVATGSNTTNVALLTTTTSGFDLVHGTSGNNEYVRPNQNGMVFHYIAWRA